MVSGLDHLDIRRFKDGKARLGVSEVSWSDLII